MKYLLLAMICVACDVSYTALTAHKDSCVAQGLAIKAESEGEGLPCWAIEARLQHHVRTNTDCLAYWGDAGVDLRCGADGGTDAGD